MEELKVFQNSEFGKLEVLNINGKFYFPATACAKILGYIKPNNAISTHCRYTLKQGVPHPQNSEKTIEINFIPEGDLYRLITHSKLPEAERFEKWVFDEVLPQIRQTGGYIPIKEDEPNELLFARALMIAAETIKQKDEVIAQKVKQLDEQKPLVHFANQVSNTNTLIDMGQMAKLLKDENIDIGRNKLFEWLRGKKILMRNNIPYQQYIESGHFKVKESASETPYGTKTFMTTYITGKGQIYITNKLRKEMELAY